jgi:hypothetical protein
MPVIARPFAGLRLAFTIWPDRGPVDAADYFGLTTPPTEGVLPDQPGLKTREKAVFTALQRFGPLLNYYFST